MSNINYCTLFSFIDAIIRDGRLRIVNDFPCKDNIRGTIWMGISKQIHCIHISYNGPKLASIKYTNKILFYNQSLTNYSQ